MTERTQSQTGQSEQNTQSEAANGPSHDTFTEQRGQYDKPYLRKIGVAFEHRDRKGFTLDNFANPHDGKIIMRSVSERLENKRSGEEAQHQAQNEGRQA